ncbi:protein disulfide-isomerase [Clonorchis sinensis]|uniref:Protein disulfide-isomerase n=1 Tax=Clonorchis sinensis TaxID=79923 RepID=G7Y6D8_CLOSI|nr:protein disulfide-isomerase [Clonorchis sinensis]
MKRFQVNVASRLADDTQRLIYLVHYCSGEAKAAIEDCVLLTESDGFVRAMDILHEEFGRPHDIAQSFIDSILVGGPIAAEDTDALSKLVREMHSCEIALTQMGYTADLNCSKNLKWIVMRLPRHLQREWAKAKSPEEKLQALRERKLCFNCLKPNHRANKSRAPNHCDVPRCGKRYHRLLRVDSYVKPPTPSTVNINSNSVDVTTAFLGFLPVRLVGPHGTVLCYALLGSGSDSTFVLLEVADRIGLKGTPTEVEFNSIIEASKEKRVQQLLV